MRRSASAVILCGVATAERQSALAQFVAFARSLRGDQKSGARDFSNAPSLRLGGENRALAKMSPLER